MPGANSSAPLVQMPIVTAGLRCAPDLYATYTPEKTARPHPKLMRSQPPSNPLFFGRMTLATTPAPSRMSIPVPITSEMKASVIVKSTVDPF